LQVRHVSGNKNENRKFLYDHSPYIQVLANPSQFSIYDKELAISHFLSLLPVERDLEKAIEVARAFW
jgi:hypothetical protein